MKHLISLFTLVCFVALVWGCSGNDNREIAERWSLGESTPYTEPEAWWSMNLQSGREPGECGGYREHAPLYLKVKLYTLRTQWNLDDEFWISVGGPFAEPTRHWFQCDAPSSASYSVDDELVGATCFSDYFIFQYHEQHHPSGLPPWIVSQIDWTRIGDMNRPEILTIGEFDVPFRIYEPRTGRILELMVSYEVSSTSLVSEAFVDLSRESAMSNPSGEPPSEPTCLEDLWVERPEVYDITEECGRDTNCRVRVP